MDSAAATAAELEVVAAEATAAELEVVAAEATATELEVVAAELEEDLKVDSEVVATAVLEMD